MLGHFIIGKIFIICIKRSSFLVHLFITFMNVSSSLSVSECDSGYSGVDFAAKPMSRPTSVYSFNEPQGARGGKSFYVNHLTEHKLVRGHSIFLGTLHALYLGEWISIFLFTKITKYLLRTIFLNYFTNSGLYI